VHHVPRDLIKLAVWVIRCEFVLFLFAGVSLLLN
jgi:hypothetical protein